MKSIPYKDVYSADERRSLVDRWAEVSLEAMATAFELAVAQQNSSTKALADVARIDPHSDWRGATIAGPISASLNGCQAKLVLSRLRLEFASLDQLDLRGAEIVDCCLRWSIWSQCNLSRGIIRNTTGRKMLFVGCALREASITDSRIRDARVVESDLDYASIEGSDLINIALLRTTLRGTKIVGCDMTGAYFEEVETFPVDVGRWGAVLDGASVSRGRRDNDDPTVVAIRLCLREWALRHNNRMVEVPACYLKTGRALCDQWPTPSAVAAFVAMPFSNSELPIYSDAIKPVLESFGLRVWRADEIPATGAIMCKVCYRIQEAGIAFFEVTDANPNVMLELGLALGRGVRSILLRRATVTTGPLITDLQGLEFIAYSSTEDLRERLGIFLHRFLGGTGLDMIPRDVELDLIQMREWTNIGVLCD